ncbi:hypothetical protein H5300_14690 [Vibrio sp. SG41-7]|uniref:hypothetical protein n=1 Tax=Vibrio sp. SG41-7 TaxID=2760973 RepID=UPI0015FFC726|nr:hypothetical protein [Vibrio sp. SG41-7]MBB1464561.1 hypothetical protein [Vibrio sp. SG41-7]
MKQLNTYDTKEEGEEALAKIDEPKRLASERDSTEVIYNVNDHFEAGLPRFSDIRR